jgi:diketogulonate reductase-like aldo/keto reductase
MRLAPKVRLTHGVDIDAVGYGVYKVPPAETAALCTLALEAGYRTLDTATLYGNEAGVGEAVRGALAGGLERRDIVVTTKVLNSDQGYDSTLRAFDSSLELLGLEYVDLYLIHWPLPARGLYVETYRALERLYADGRVRAIGVSNFQQEHLERLLAEAEVVPAVNQIEVHPYLQQHALRAFNADHGIATQAWSPLGRGNLLGDPVIGAVAAELGRTPAQVILRWHLDAGNLVIPKASSAGRIRENLDLFDFSLSPAQRVAIDGLERGQRFGSHPDKVSS